MTRRTEARSIPIEIVASGARSLYPSARNVVFLCGKCFIARDPGHSAAPSYVAVDPDGRVKRAARAVGYFRRCSDCQRSDRYDPEFEIDPYDVRPS